MLTIVTFQWARKSTIIKLQNYRREQYHKGTVRKHTNDAQNCLDGGILDYGALSVKLTPENLCFILFKWAPLWRETEATRSRDRTKKVWIMARLGRRCRLAQTIPIRQVGWTIGWSPRNSSTSFCVLLLFMSPYNILRTPYLINPLLLLHYFKGYVYPSRD